LIVKETMEMNYLLNGILIGFALAVPIGPIAVLCIRQTLSNGHLSGMVIGLGAATSDFLYSGLAALGLTIISTALNSLQLWARIAGAAVLLIIGIKIFITKYRSENTPINTAGMLKSYILTFLFALMNPVPFFAFISVFTIFGIGHNISNLSALTLAFGVFIGSLLWFITLSSIVTLLKHKMNFDRALWMNRITGSVIILYGFFAILSLL
jgi:threonine/homoserine/homoserine lactone efflux protein